MTDLIPNPRKSCNEYTQYSQIWAAMTDGSTNGQQRALRERIDFEIRKGMERHGLRGDLHAEAQNSSKWKAFVELRCRTRPFLRKYKDCWPVQATFNLAVRKHLEARAASKRATAVKSYPSPQSSPRARVSRTGASHQRQTPRQSKNVSSAAKPSRVQVRSLKSAEVTPASATPASSPQAASRKNTLCDGRDTDGPEVNVPCIYCGGSSRVFHAEENPDLLTLCAESESMLGALVDGGLVSDAHLKILKNWSQAEIDAFVDRLRLTSSNKSFIKQKLSGPRVAPDTRQRVSPPHIPVEGGGAKSRKRKAVDDEMERWIDHRHKVHLTASHLDYPAVQTPQPPTGTYAGPSEIPQPGEELKMRLEDLENSVDLLEEWMRSRYNRFSFREFEAKVREAATNYNLDLEFQVSGIINSLSPHHLDLRHFADQWPARILLARIAKERQKVRSGGNIDGCMYQQNESQAFPYLESPSKTPYWRGRGPETPSKNFASSSRNGQGNVDGTTKSCFASPSRLGIPKLVHTCPSHPDVDLSKVSRNIIRVLSSLSPALIELVPVFASIGVHTEAALLAFCRLSERVKKLQLGKLRLNPFMKSVLRVEFSKANVVAFETALLRV